MEEYVVDVFVVAVYGRGHLELVVGVHVLIGRAEAKRVPQMAAAVGAIRLWQTRRVSFLLLRLFIDTC